MKALSTVAIITALLLLTSSVLYLSTQPIQAQEAVEKVQLSENQIRIQSGQNPILDLELVENTAQCLVDCSAVIKLHPYQDITLPESENSDYKWEFLKASAEMPGLLSHSFELLTNVTYTTKVPILTDQTFYYPFPTNGTKLTLPSECSQTNSTHYQCTLQTITAYTETNLTKEEYQPFQFWGQTLQANRDYYLKLKGTKQASLQANSIDWLPTIKGVPIQEWEWWNTSWSYRKQINITDQSNTAFTDYPIVVENFNCESNCNESGKDIRVVVNENVSQVEFGLQKVNSSYFNIAFWANVTSPNGTNSSYYVYYGNMQAQPANRSWNLSRWNFYDDFESGYGNITTHNGTSNASLEQAYSGSYSLKLQGGGGPNGFATIAHWNITDTGIQAQAVKQDKDGDVASWDGFTLMTKPELKGVDQFVNTMRAVWHGENGGRIDHRWYGSDAVENSASSASPCNMSVGNWYIHQATWFRNNHTMFSISSTCNITTNQINSTPTGESTGRVGLTSHPNAATYFDNLAFRKYLYPEPLVTVGEQTLPSGTIVNEQSGLTAIKLGITDSSRAGGQTLEYHQVSQVTLGGQEQNGTFDVVLEAGDQTWAFNYKTGSETFANLSNITTAFITWENSNLTSNQISVAVKDLIDNTAV